MKGKPWNGHRVLTLLLALIIFPIPTLWFTRPGWLTGSPVIKNESSLSLVTLGLGGQFCLMPVLLGLMTIFWHGPSITLAAFAEGSAEILAGCAALFGLYAARTKLIQGSLLIAGCALGMAVIATWALPAIAVLGVLVTMTAVVRWYAPPAHNMPA